MQKWYKSLYRRHLLDMHINDDNDFYLSKFDANAYFDNLKRAKIQSPMIYLQAHTGLCYFPTKLAKTHSAMKGENNEIRKLVTLCKNDGMKVVGYYSLIFNNYAEDRHPEWAIRYGDGKTWREEKGERYGLCCPNNDEYRDFVAAQIKELFAYYPDLDGIFYDMPYWEVVCRCKSCREKYLKEYGEPLPEYDDVHDPKFRRFMLFRQDRMADFCRFVKEKTAEIAPNVTVEFNYAAAVNCTWLAGSTEKISAQSEFASGDLLGNLRPHSFACKYYYGVTNNQPFEYMNTRCDDCLREHTITKKENRMLAEVMLNCAHHGASLSIDAINLDGTMDERVYDRLGRVFARQIPYEKIMDKGELYSEVAVYYNSDIQFETNDRPSNKTCCVQAHTTLCEKHIPCAIITNITKGDLSKYKVIVAPSLLKSENSLADELVAYVENGGYLYLSGTSDEDLIKTFFDGKVLNQRVSAKKGHNAYCYVSPTDKIKDCFGEFNAAYPLPLSYYAPEVHIGKGEILATLNEPITDPEDYMHYGSIHSNPPYRLTNKPVMAEVGYGKGKVFWTTAEIEADDRSGFKEVFVSIIERQIKTPLYEVIANENVEVVTFVDGDALYMSFYNYAYEQMPDIANKAAVKFAGAISVEPVCDENPIALTENSFEISFNLFAAVRVTFKG